MEQVSFTEVTEFCRRLSKATGRKFRLPSDAEWEYACRAGTTTQFHFGDALPPDLANYDTAQPYGKAAAKPGRTRTTPLGSLGNANGFGLFDMHGNVIEWVADVYHDGLPSKPSVWRAGGDSRFWVARGGGWNSPGYAVRSAFRYRIPPANLDSNLGFRLALGE